MEEPGGLVGELAVDGGGELGDESSYAAVWRVCAY